MLIKEKEVIFHNGENIIKKICCWISINQTFLLNYFIVVLITHREIYQSYIIATEIY